MSTKPGKTAKPRPSISTASAWSPRIPCYIGGEDRGETADLAHFVSTALTYYSAIPAFRSPSAIRSSIGCG
jgi:hypothetical protein